MGFLDWMQQLEEGGCGMNHEWIGTGKAAAILGYNRDHFCEKFERIIPSRKLPGGHFRWLEAVKHLAGRAAVVGQSSRKRGVWVERGVRHCACAPRSTHQHEGVDVTRSHYVG